MEINTDNPVPDIAVAAQAIINFAKDELELSPGEAAAVMATTMAIIARICDCDKDHWAALIRIANSVFESGQNLLTDGNG